MALARAMPTWVAFVWSSMGETTPAEPVNTMNVEGR
jgi:hypothetical protein